MAKEKVSQKDIIELLKQFESLNIRVTGFEALMNYDGQAGFSRTVVD